MKPENLLMSSKSSGKDQVVKLTDFGLAMRLANKDEKFGVCGTVGYMAPEVMR